MRYMFFKKNVEAEDIRLDELNNALNKLFNRHVSGFALKAEDIVNRIKMSEEEFIDACDRFESITDEPDYDDEFVPAKVDLSVLKSQKRSYVETLKRIMDNEFDSNKTNKHEFYSEFLDYIKHKRDRILKANATFRFVFMSYAKYIKRFKDIFSMIDRNIERLEYEIGNINQEYDVYKSIHGKITGIVNVIDEESLLEEELDSLESKIEFNKNSAVAEDKDDLKLDRIKKEVETLEEKIVFKEKTINSIFLQLKRAVRKYDYLVGKKGKLLNIVLDPINLISNENEYLFLKKELVSLREAINKKEIQIKNSKETVEHISNILNSDILNDIKEIIELRFELSKSKSGLKSIMRIAEDNRMKIADKRRRVESIKRLKLDIDEAKRRIIELKESLENDFIKHYKKKIVIKGVEQS